MKVIVCFLFTAFLLPAQSEVLEGAVKFIVRQPNGGTNPIPSIWMGANNGNSLTTQYSIRICADDASRSCTSGNYITQLCNQDEPNIASSPQTECNFSTWTIGSINLQDGAQHHIYPWVISKVSSPANDVLMDYANFKNPSLSSNCCGYPIRWDQVNNTLAEDYTPIITSSTPATADQFAILVDSSQTVSTGTTAGNLVCSGESVGSGSAAIYDNGLAGIWMAAHTAAKCSNVFEANLGGGSASMMTKAGFNSAFSSILTNLIPSSVQYYAVAWFKPNTIQDNNIGPPNNDQYGLSGYLTYFSVTRGAAPLASSCLGSAPADGIGQATANPWFNSGPDYLPFTNYNVRPTALLAGTICPTCTNSTNSWQNAPYQADGPTFKAIVTAAKSAVGTNPTGIAQTTFTNDPSRSATAREYVPALNGDVINSHVTQSLCGSYASPVSGSLLISSPCTLTGNVMFINSGVASWGYTSSFGFVAGAGFASTITSTAAGNDLSQSPDSGYMGGGNGAVTGTPAVAVGGAAIEPCQALPRKAIDPNLFQQYYYAGFDALQAYYKARFDVWGDNFIGEPLAQPFSATATPRTRRDRGR